MPDETLMLDVSSLKPSAIHPSTKAIAQYLLNNADSGEKPWWEVGAAEYRRLQDAGQTSWPAPPQLPRGSYVQMPSRDPTRRIKGRLIRPQSTLVKGVVLHMHGGGFVLAHCDWIDFLLAYLADALSLAFISLEYRLAPEQPFPAAPEDCHDAAEHLVDTAVSEYGAPLVFLMGESAGASLAALTALHLLDARPKFQLSGILCAYGLFDLSLLPSVRQFEAPLIMTTENVERFIEAYTEGMAAEDRRGHRLSPMYHPRLRLLGAVKHDYGGESVLSEEKLPPALFLTGTADATVDDQVLMAFRWRARGGDARVKFVPGMIHAFLLFEADKFDGVREGREALVEFMKEMVEK